MHVQCTRVYVSKAEMSLCCHEVIKESGWRSIAPLIFDCGSGGGDLCALIALHLVKQLLIHTEQMAEWA